MRMMSSNVSDISTRAAYCSLIRSASLLNSDSPSIIEASSEPYGDLMRTFIRHADLLGTYAWIILLAGWLGAEATWWMWAAMLAYGLIATAKDVCGYLVERRI